MSPRAKGYLITILGVIAISPDGLLTRFIGADALTISFWRGLFFGLTSMTFLALRYRCKLTHLLASFQPPEYGVMLAYCFGNLFFIYSITHTSVANTLFMLSTTPIWAALIAWLFLKQAVPRRTWCAIAAVFGGIIVISLGSHAGAGSVTGDLLGLMAAATLATLFSLIRQMRDRDMLPALALGGILTALLTAPLANLHTTTIDMAYLVIMGVIMLPVANALLFLGPRYLPAPEVGLVMLLETILGPIWVWLILSENPGVYSIVGGGIVLTTLAINMYFALRADNNDVVSKCNRS